MKAQTRPEAHWAVHPRAQGPPGHNEIAFGFKGMAMSSLPITKTGGGMVLERMLQST